MFYHFIKGNSSSKQISISNSKSSVVAGESVDLKCSATIEDFTMQHVWSGPAINDMYNGSRPILSLHNIHLSEAGEYKCSASLHNLFITAGIPVVLQCK